MASRQASRQVWHNWIEFPGSQTFNTDIATLRNSFVAGNLVKASDYNLLATMINNMNGHYHNYTDLYYNSTYGNSPVDRNTYQESKNTNSIDSASNVNTVNVGNTITIAQHNAAALGVSQLRVHYHGINDRTA